MSCFSPRTWIPTFWRGVIVTCAVLGLSAAAVNAAPTISSTPATSATTSTLTVTVGDATKPRAEHFNVRGSNVVFRVTATGTGALSYQWRLNGAALTDGGAVAGATTASLTLSGVEAAQAGVYTLNVTDSTGVTTAQISALTVQPASVVATQGAAATFSFGPVGTAPFTYQWYVTNLSGATPVTTAISGATGASYTISNVATSNAGGYHVVATDARGNQFKSWRAVLAVLPKLNTTAVFDITAAPYNASTAAADNTTAIQTAINAARVNTVGGAGGTVLVPAGTFFSGPLTLYSNVKLQIAAGGVLKALPYSGGTVNYPNPSSPSSFIVTGSGQTNIEIAGPGTIDGNGGGYSNSWWGNPPSYGSPQATRPRLIRFNGTNSSPVTNVYVHDITLTNSPSFHCITTSTNNAVFSNVTVSTDPNGPNTDALDPHGTNMIIRNCSLSSGDDNIAVKAGGGSSSANYPVINLAIDGCTFGYGHGLSVGGQSDYGLNGMTVVNCTFANTTSGLRLKADPTQGGYVQNLVYANLSMSAVQYPIVFYSYYSLIGNPGDGRAETNAASYNSAPPIGYSYPGTLPPAWKNILLSDMNTTGTTGAHNVMWGIAYGARTPDLFVSGVRLNNVALDKNLDLVNAYDVQATGSTTLSPSPFTYNSLIISAQPRPAAVAPGGTATFSVSTLGTSGVATVQSPSIQWRLNGVALTNGTQSDGSVVSGATTSTLTVTNVQPTRAGAYTALVTNSLDAYTTSLVARSYAVSATSDAGNLATLSLGNLSQSYDGTPRAVMVTTSPANLTVQTTYNGSTTVPTAVGTYAVVATLADADYAGSISGTLVIGKGSQSITFSAPTTAAATGTLNLDAGASSGLAVSYASNNAAVATVSGNVVSFVGPGVVTLTASQAGNANWFSAQAVSRTISVGLNYAGWAAQRGLTNAAADATASPAGDGIANLLKYALGLDPNVAVASGALPTVGADGIFRFTEPAWTTGISYAVQTSTDLVNWTDAQTISATMSAELQARSYTLPAGESRQFVRLKVTMP